MPDAASHNPASLVPVAPEERIHALDLLRGWAMFGVLWSNLNDWYGPRNPATALDRGLLWTQDHLVESRFYTLLILLFGIGFGIQLLRAASQGTDLRTTYYRRSAALLVIGIVHGTFIFSGDILTIYSLVAFALVMFRTASTRRVLTAAILLWFLGGAIVGEVMFLGGLRFMIVPSPGQSGYLRWLGRWGLRFYPTILAAFLMGLWAVKSGYLRRVIEDSRSTRRLLFVAVIAAAVGYASWAYASALWPPPHAPPDFQGRFPYPYYQLNYVLRGLALSLFNWATEGTSLAYAALLLLLWQRPRGARLLRPLAATGRMALTTYLTQSVVCALLFQRFALGWRGHVTYTGMFLITLILFGCQMAASTWWLKRFRFGPAEWLWRKLTYGHVPPMRLLQTSAA